MISQFINRPAGWRAPRRALFALALLLPAIVGAGGPNAAHTSTDAIRRVAEATVQAAAKRIGATIVATAAALDPRLQLHACGGELQGFIAGDGQLRASTTVGVRCESPVPWTIYVRVNVSSEQTVLSARRPLPRGATLADADVEVARRTIPGIGSQYISDATQLVGRRLRRPLAAGEPLTADSLVVAPVVLRGQQLTLVARTGAMEIRVAVVAMSDGRPDERIAVRNIATQRIVEAVIRSNGLAEIPL